MNDLFLKIINMSISASWLVLAVLLLRFVLKKAPKWVNVLLWGIVAVRLAFPFSIESALSLIPSAETVPMDIEMAVQPTINSGVPVINSMVNPMLSSFAPPQDVLTSANPLQIWIPIFSMQHCSDPRYNSPVYTNQMLLEDWGNGCCRFWTPIPEKGNDYEKQLLHCSAQCHRGRPSLVHRQHHSEKPPSDEGGAVGV